MTEESSTVPVVAELSRLRKRRSANRNIVKGWIVKIRDLMNKGQDERIMRQVQVQLQMIEKKENEISI